MPFSLDGLSTTATVAAGAEQQLFAAGGSCAAWRYLMVEAPFPVGLRLRWTGLLPLGAAQMTGRSLQVCLHASHLEAWATNPGPSPVEVAVATLLSAERVTQNVLDLAIPTQGTTKVPAFAVSARLDAPPLDNPSACRLELLDGAGAVIAAVAVGQTVPLGRATAVRTVCPVAHRVVFTLSL